MPPPPGVPYQSERRQGEAARRSDNSTLNIVEEVELVPNITTSSNTSNLFGGDGGEDLTVSYQKDEFFIIDFIA